MAKRRKARAPRKKPSYYARFRSRVRRSKPKIPLETAITAVAIPFTPAADGWNSPFGLIQSGNLTDLGPTLMKGFIGIDPEGGMNLLSVFNPFDFNSARYTKMLIASGLVHKVRKKFVNIPMDRVPILGKYLS